MVIGVDVRVHNEDYCLVTQVDESENEDTYSDEVLSDGEIYFLEDNDDEEQSSETEENVSEDEEDQSEMFNCFDNTLFSKIVMQYAKELPKICHKAQMTYIKTLPSCALLSFTIPVKELSSSSQWIESMSLSDSMSIKVEIAVSTTNGAISLISTRYADANGESLLDIQVLDVEILKCRMNKYLHLLSFPLHSFADPKVNLIMTSVYCSEMEALRMLKKCHWDVDEAVLGLLSDTIEVIPPPRIEMSPENSRRDDENILQLCLDKERFNHDTEFESIIHNEIYDIHERFPFVDIVALCEVYQANNCSVARTEEDLRRNHTITTASPLPEPPEHFTLFSDIEKLESVLMHSPQFLRHRMHWTHPNKLITLYHLLEAEILTYKSQN